MTVAPVSGRSAIVLAAGRGTRMRSALPKVLHPVAGRPMLEWVLDAARAAGCRRILVVVGHGADQIRAEIPGDDLVFVEQREQRGTGHAVSCCIGPWKNLTDKGGGAAAEAAPSEQTVLVLSGDAPLVRVETLQALCEAAEAGWGAVAVAEVDRPGSLGRVIEGSEGELLDIVEAADASSEELSIRSVNSGHYAVRAPAIFELLAELACADSSAPNAQGELYLTDAVVRATRTDRPVRCLRLDDPAEAWGVNDRQDLARVDRQLIDRQVARVQQSGVTVLEPERVRIEGLAEVAPDAVIHPGVTLLGNTRIGPRSVLHQGAWLRDCEIDADVEVMPYSVLDGAKVASRCAVGPFARLRPGAELGEAARVGNFVEVKKATLGRGSKANHLAYLGDATIGAGSNIGAGVVTCNYDGENKHHTEVGEGAFVGSDTMLVAPVTVGDRATTGAGSVITQDVPADALAVGRARQKNLPDWRKKRSRTDGDGAT